MSSYRVVVAVGALREGIDPAAVVPAAADAASALTVVEASGLSLARGVATATVRFSADDDAEAEDVADAVVDTVRTLAAVGRVQLLRLRGGRWVRIRDRA